MPPECAIFSDTRRERCVMDNWDNGDGSSRPLPKPELNPLQNPVLADNSATVAQVYFTSPPEKREQAVVELLLKLGHAARPDCCGGGHRSVRHRPGPACHRSTGPPAATRVPSVPGHQWSDATILRTVRRGVLRFRG